MANFQVLAERVKYYQFLFALENSDVYDMKFIGPDMLSERYGLNQDESKAIVKEWIKHYDVVAQALVKKGYVVLDGI